MRLDRLEKGALEQTPGHSHTLTAVGALFKMKAAALTTTQNHYQLNCTDSRVRILSSPTLSSVGELIELIATRLDQHIRGPLSVQGGRKEKYSRVWTDMHQLAGFTLQCIVLSCNNVFLFFFCCFHHLSCKLLITFPSFFSFPPKSFSIQRYFSD